MQKKKKKHPSAVIGQVSRSLCRPLVFFFFFYFYFFFVFALSLFGGPLVVSKTCRGQRHGYANKALAWIVPKRRHSGAILALSASFASGTAKIIRRSNTAHFGLLFFYAPNPGVLSSEGIDWVLLAAPATSTINLRSSDLRAHSLRHAYAALILRSRQQLPGMGGYRNEVKVIFLFQREQPKNNTKTPWGRLGGKKS